MAPAEHPDSLGRGRYVVGRLLGEGSSKLVYHARDQRLARDVAIAVVKLDGLSPQARSAVLREAERSGRLGDHPNIVAIYDVEVEDEVPYVVYEYVSEQSLAEVLDRTPERRLDREAVLAVGADVSAALAHAHARGVIHRALKPKRIWLAERGVLVGDFGLAAGAGTGRFTEEGSALGAVHYTAPEQLLGRAVDGRADLYALGALLYELACGAPPFCGPGVETVIAQHLNQDPTPPSELRDELPAEFDALVLALLAKDPGLRPSSAATVRAALLALAHAPRSPRPTASPAASASPRDTENALELLDQTFVGRINELGRLHLAFTEACAGVGRVTLVAGQAGMGKTRLADELARYAENHGAYVLWGRCHETGGAPAYWPWIQVARAYARASGRPMAEAESPAEEPQPSRAQLFESFAALLRSAAQERPVLVVLDDLHRADKPSLLVLAEVARRLSDTRLLVLGSYRDDEVDDQHPLAEMLGELERVPSFQRLVLQGLSAPDVQALLSAGAQERLHDAEAELASAVHRESDGNPFFVHELVRHLIETRRLAQRDGRWTSEVSAVTELGIPDGVRDVVGQRLTRRSSECLRVLVAAAVIGREFPAGALPKVAGLDPGQVDSALNEALAARIIRPLRHRSPRYIFSHTLIRETLYSDLSLTRRARLHGKVGEALEALYGDGSPRHVSELAHHFAEGAAAGDPAKAIEYGRRAGEQAMRQFAYEAAAAHLRRTLAILDRDQPVDLSLRCELLLDLGDAEWAAGEFERSREAFRAAVEIARELNDSDKLARAALGYGGRMAFGAGVRDDTLIALLEEAITGVRTSDPFARARLTGRLAEALAFTAPLEHRQELIDRAVTTAEETGDPRVLAYVLSNAHWALWTPDNVRQRLDMANEIIRLARAARDYDLEFDGLHWRVSDLMELGAVGEAEREVTTWSQRAQEHRRLYPQWLVAVFRAMRKLEQGELEDGERLALKAMEIGQRGHNENALQLLGVQLATVRREQGRYGELEPGLLAFAEQYPAIPAWRCALALMFSESGRLAEARAQFERLAGNRFEAITRDMFWLPAMAIVSQVCVNLGDSERADLLYELLSPFRHRNMMLGTVATSWGSAARTLGALAMTTGRPDVAARDYEDALQHNARFGANVWLAHTQHEYAALLSARGGPGDRSRARELEARALEAAKRMHLARLIERKPPLDVVT
jgi:tetratricopeptide (TPR) repeat protein